MLKPTCEQLAEMMISDAEHVIYWFDKHNLLYQHIHAGRHQALTACLRRHSSLHHEKSLCHLTCRDMYQRLCFEDWLAVHCRVESVRSRNKQTSIAVFEVAPCTD